MRTAGELALRIRGLLIGCAVILAFSYSDAATSLDNTLSALRMSALKRNPSGTITVVTIDPESLQTAGDWPWPRDRFALALDNLNAAGAGMIAVDVDFSARSTPDEDAALKAALERNSGWIVLPAFLQRDLRTSNTPIAAFADHSVIASVNVELSKDGIARQYRRSFFYTNAYYPTLGAVLAGALPGDTRSFSIDYGIDVDRIDTVSFDDVLNNRFDPELISGRSIIIGATALELGDNLSTPHSAALPGVFVHALGYESLIQNRALKTPSKTWMSCFALLFLAIGELIVRHFKLARIQIMHAVFLLTVLAVSYIVQAFFPVSLNIAPLLAVPAYGIAAASWRELGQRKRQLSEQRESHLYYIARHDSETGLQNRRAMLEHLEAQKTSGRGERLLVAAFGIERYEDLRSAIGYANATDLVNASASAFRTSGLSETFFRLDGAVIGTAFHLEAGQDAEASLASIHKQLQQSLIIAGQPTEISLKAGIVLDEDASTQAEILLERATLSLDHAKRTRRPVAVWGEAEFEDPQFRLTVLTDITAGLDRNEFQLMYQPKMCTRTNTVLGAEALIRWHHPRFGQIPPDQFITIAEDTGAIDSLTLWAVRQAIADQDAISRRGVDICIAVNMSARSLCDQGFCERIIELVQISGASIKIEITETAVIENPETAIRSVNAFRDAGIRLAIDDYGAGQSSIAYLKQLSVQELKLDRSMIMDVKESQRDRMILKSTFDLAHALNMRVVCEGVEDAATFAALTTLGCDAIQGYFVSRPLSVEPLIQFVITNSQNATPSIAS
jgi:EAL domain-containing protein (putative c-di-GMP-specific phosphodiesterase class I)/CHASE2 domain-containing sensor protein/GGDEF domain-containing protein